MTQNLEKTAWPNKSLWIGRKKADAFLKKSAWTHRSILTLSFLVE